MIDASSNTARDRSAWRYPRCTSQVRADEIIAGFHESGYGQAAGGDKDDVRPLAPSHRGSSARGIEAKFHPRSRALTHEPSMIRAFPGGAASRGHRAPPGSPPSGIPNTECPRSAETRAASSHAGPTPMTTTALEPGARILVGMDRIAPGGRVFEFWAKVGGPSLVKSCQA